MTLAHGPKTPANLVLCLDAGNPKSYSGSGTVWRDVSGNKNHFNIIAGAYNASGWMDFNGSYGIAKNSGTNIPLTDATGITYVVATRILNSNSNWRTLTRSWTGNHHVIINSGGWNIGMYDNVTSQGNIGSGYSQQSLPGYGTSAWNLLYWRWQNSSPYYQLSYNDTPGVIRASITNSASRFVDGIGVIGGYHLESSDPATANQYWGDIALFQVYNRFLTDAELQGIYSNYRGRFGL
jgi:hypothetical protein